MDLHCNILFETCPWHTRVALFGEDHKLASVHYDDVDLRFEEGTVLVGRITKLHYGLQAAFVDIGDTVDAFLPLKTIDKELQPAHEGQHLVVRVVRPKMEEKGAKLSGKVVHKLPEGSLKLPHIVQAPATALQRALLDAADTPVKVWVMDARLRAMVSDYVDDEKIHFMQQSGNMLWLERLDTELEMVREGRFPLAGGGRIVVEQTRALTSIDVDIARFQPTDSGVNPAFSCNLIAVEEIARLSRMLELGGSIVIDFITMKPRQERLKIKEALQEAFARRDARMVDVLNISPFGLMEINREKNAASLLERVKSPLYVAGEILLKLWREKQGHTPLMVEAAPEVAALLQERLQENVALAYLGRPVRVQASGARQVGSYTIAQAG